jgi:hypothetical protein
LQIRLLLLVIYFKFYLIISLRYKSCDSNSGWRLPGELRPHPRVT